VLIKSAKKSLFGLAGWTGSRFHTRRTTGNFALLPFSLFVLVIGGIETAAFKNKSGSAHQATNILAFAPFTSDQRLLVKPLQYLEPIAALDALVFVNRHIDYLDKIRVFSRTKCKSCTNQPLIPGMPFLTVTI
jgi:hypothetical protein